MVWPFGNKGKQILTPLEGYNQWAPSYAMESNPIKNLSDMAIEGMLPSLHGRRFLDAGCGPGTFCMLAEKQCASNISGIDLSPKMIELARANCPSGNFRCADLSLVRFENEIFDVIICALVLGHLECLSPALDNLLNALSHDGILIVTDFHPFLTLTQSKRTFKNHKGKQFEIQHHLHLFEEYFTSFAKHQLIVENWQEPVYNQVPVVFAVRLRKL